jgi:L-aspartate oxidase
MERLERADVIVIGAGIAGLVTAIELAPRSVIVLSKRALGRGAASAWAQGGIAAAIGDDDSPELHALDTIEVGGGINDAHAVEVLTREAAQSILELLDLGATFDVDPEGDFDLGREAAHRRRRILHRGDATGRALIDSLIAAAERTPSIRVIEDAVARDVIVDGESVRGVVFEAGGKVCAAEASAVVLASGGAAALYRYTTNPLDAVGEGIAIAARAGAVLADLEFVQFHPTALDCGRDPMPLVTEALRGEGAIVVDDTGERFLASVDPRGELAPRDIVARAVYRRRAEGHATFIDAREAVGAAFPRRFPTVFRLCMENGIDPRSALIPIAPAAHYHMGGVAVDEWGRTSLDGLWACGEVATTGVHGANRLASNSLLEAVVFGVRVARDIGGRARTSSPASVPPAQAGGPPPDERAFAAVRAAMYDDVGVVRSAHGLLRALHAFDEIEARADSLALRNRITVCRLIAQAAYDRRESRGSHFRSDFPEADESFAHRSFVSAAGS